MIRVWPDLVAYIILGVAGFYLLAFLYLSLLFSSIGEKILGVLLWGAPVVAVAWAGYVVLT